MRDFSYPYILSFCNEFTFDAIGKILDDGGVKSFFSLNHHLSDELIVSVVLFHLYCLFS